MLQTTLFHHTEVLTNVQADTHVIAIKGKKNISQIVNTTITAKR